MLRWSSWRGVDKETFLNAASTFSASWILKSANPKSVGAILIARDLCASLTEEGISIVKNKHLFGVLASMTVSYTSFQLRS